MPVFTGVAIQRVTKNIDAAGNEKVVVERVIAEVSGVVALDNLGAAFQLGHKLAQDYDKELLTNVMVKVQQTHA